MARPPETHAMLEMSQLVHELAALATESRTRAQKTTQHLARAVRQATLSPANWNEAYSVEKAAAVRWDCADILTDTPGVVYAPPFAAPAAYSALAADGSQIPLDRHAAAPCFVVNVGEIALHYGTGERPLLQTQAQLFYKEEDVYVNNSPVTERHIGQKRAEAEWQALAKLATNHATRTALALSDGPLILVFANQREGDAEQRETAAAFCATLQTAQDAGVPVAGYVSRPGARDVVGALRVSLCGDGCGHGKDDLCSELSRLTDAALFGRLLTRAGDRSAVFGSQARALNLYPAAHKVRFFYLQTGTEIARVEVPAWVADDADLLARVHVLTIDQLQKGQGYPVCLSEAHERAVVRGPDRDAFLHLVERALVQGGVPALATRKALAKRTRVL